MFSFQTSKGYQKLQEDYMHCIETNDPNSLFIFLRTNPFHVEALFQACLFYLLQSNYEQTDVLLQRLLYAFQLSFHHQFSVISPDVRLTYEGSLYNKLWFQSLFMQVDILGRKGCSRTALEFSKLLLSICPQTDPMGSLFMVEYFALRCKKVVTTQYDFFIHFTKHFCRETHGRGELLCLPNFLYSLAYVKLMQSPTPDKPPPVSPSLLPSLSSLQSIPSLFDSDPNTVLLFAVSCYPGLAVSLLQKLSKSLTVTLPVHDMGIGDTSRVADIYSERCGDLWKAEATANWLRSACTVAAGVEDGWVERWKGMVELPFRADRYAGLDKMRFSDTVQTAIPQELLVAGGGAQRRMRPRGNLNPHMHPVLLFFATLLPWNAVDFGPE